MVYPNSTLPLQVAEMVQPMSPLPLCWGSIPTGAVGQLPGCIAAPTWAPLSQNALGQPPRCIAVPPHALGPRGCIAALPTGPSVPEFTGTTPRMHCRAPTVHWAPLSQDTVGLCPPRSCRTPPACTGAAPRMHYDPPLPWRVLWGVPEPSRGLGVCGGSSGRGWGAQVGLGVAPGLSPTPCPTLWEALS